MTASSAAFVFSWAAASEGTIAFLRYIAEAIKRPDEAWMRTGSFGDKTLVLLAQFLRGREVFGGHHRGNAEPLRPEKLRGFTMALGTEPAVAC